MHCAKNLICIFIFIPYGLSYVRTHYSFVQSHTEREGGLKKLCLHSLKKGRMEIDCLAQPTQNLCMKIFGTSGISTGRGIEESS